ncbi:MAG: methylated-DNA--[protein]-cysteine S-methyltransferase [Candidatus Krumholzibacteriia bacterium]
MPGAKDPRPADLPACVVPSPLGPLRLTGDGAALTAIDFHAGGRAAAGRPADPLLREAARQLAAYFAGRLRVFDLPLAPHGTPFRRAVWEALLGVPWGATASYGQIARRIGRPRAVRAVGAANGANPLPIVIPCHRIVGADGSLTGYAGGLAIKAQLLELEGITLV